MNTGFVPGTDLFGGWHCRPGSSFRPIEEAKGEAKIVWATKRELGLTTGTLQLPNPSQSEDSGLAGIPL